MDDVAMHLLFAANRWESYKEICLLLEQGTTVILDRYAYSGAAYTAAKGYPISWCKEADKGLLKPNIVFYMDINTEIANKRIIDAKDEREIYEHKEFQIKVARAFGELKEKGWFLMDATQSQRKITETAYDVFLNTSKNAPFKREHLWV
jgi:dTMP kinase